MRCFDGHPMKKGVSQNRDKSSSLDTVLDADNHGSQGDALP